MSRPQHGAPKGKGLAVDRVNIDRGFTGSNPPVRSLAGKVIQNLFAMDKDSIDVMSKTVDFDSLLNRGDELKRFIVISSLLGESMSQSNLAHAINLGYGVDERTGSLFNNIVKILIAPAAVVEDGVVKNVMTEISMTREYDTVTRGCEMVIPREAVAAIKRARLQKFNDISNNLSEKVLDNPDLDTKRQEDANNTLSLIKKAIASQVEMMKQSLMIAFPEEALDALTRDSIESNVAETIMSMSMSIIQNVVQGSQDPIKDLREENTTRNLHRDLLKRSLENVFALSKNKLTNTIPEFINQLGKVCHEFSENVTTNERFSENSRLTSPAGEFPIAYVLTVSEDVHSLLMPFIKYGQVKGTMPIEYHDASQYFSHTQTGRDYIVLREDKNRQPNLPGDGDLAMDVVDPNNKNLDGTVQQLVPEAQNLFGYEEPLGEGKLVRDVETTGRLPIDKSVSFMLTSIEEDVVAIVIHTVREKSNGTTYDQSKDESVSGLKTMNHMMRVTVGDFDYSAHMQEVVAYSGAVSKKQIGSDNPLGLYGNKPVTLHTEDISPNRHQFGFEELKAAFLDPVLFDSQGIVTKWNNFLKEKKTFGDIKGVENRRFRQLSKRKELEIAYYTSGAFKEDLMRLEFSPYFQVDVKEDGKTMSAPRRNYVGDIPAFVSDPRDHARMSAILTPTNVSALEEALIKDRDAYTEQLFKEGGKLEDVKPKNSLAELKNIVMNAFGGMDDIKDYIAFSDDDLIRLVIVPSITNLKAYYTMNNAVAATKTGQDLWLGYDGMQIGEDNTKNPILMTRHYAGNMHILLNGMGFTTLAQKALALLSMTRTLKMKSIEENIRRGYPLGITADFLKVERIPCNQMMISKHKAVDIIARPNHIVSEEMEGGSVKLYFSNTFDSVNNMTSASSLRVPNSVPKVRIDNISNNFDSRPMISTCYVSTGEYGTLDGLLESMVNSKSIIDTERIYLAKIHAEREIERRKTVEEGAKTMLESYVPILRPARQLTADPLPYLGLARHEALSESDRQTHYAAFYSKKGTVNPWISNFGSVYHQRFHHSSLLIHHKHDHVNFNSYNVNTKSTISETYQVLEQAFNFDDADQVLMSVQDLEASRKYLSTKMNSIKKIDATKSERLQGRKGNMLNKFHTAARLGYDVAHTQFVDTHILKELRDRKLGAFSKDGKQAIQSIFSGKYTVPQMIFNY